MTKDIKTKEETKNMKDTQKNSVEDYDEIDYSIINSGPLFVDKRQLEPGFHYQFVGNLPGQIEYYQRLGFEVVMDKMKVGQDKPSVSSPFGGAITVQSKCGQTMVYMRCPQKIKDRIDGFRDKTNKEKMAALGHIENIPLEHQVGKITFS